MLPQQHWHTHPCTSSPCHSLGPSIGPGTGDGSALAATAPEHTTGSSSLDHCCQPPHHVATEETHVQGIPHHPDAKAQENWHSSQGWPPALPLTQRLHTTNMSWKHTLALDAVPGKLRLWVRLWLCELLTDDAMKEKTSVLLN